jgi:hypothetical protein
MVSVIMCFPHFQKKETESQYGELYRCAIAQWTEIRRAGMSAGPESYRQDATNAPHLKILLTLDSLI